MVSYGKVVAVRDVMHSLFSVYSVYQRKFTHHCHSILDVKALLHSGETVSHNGSEWWCLGERPVRLRKSATLNMTTTTL